ncbi:MAG: hypothetical protein D6752_07075 [Candidatus Nitrosothermus koennekii]|nr:MAG: hypothetical protein D6752_07075 [Candidatus Nitrosothermus koennekii]
MIAQKSESIQELAKALLKAQKELKDKLEFSQGYGYKYAPLPEVVRVIKEAFNKNGLTFTQSASCHSKTDGGQYVEVDTLLMHESGEWIMYETSLPVPEVKGCNKCQEAGAGITYARRYALAAMAGLAAEEDTDASSNIETKNSAGKSSKKNYNGKEMLSIRTVEDLKEGEPYTKKDPEFLRTKVLPLLEEEIKHPKSEKQRKFIGAHITWLRKYLKENG